ncbi:hypothetical protein AX15_007275 [Amanita polypyramis BW_CC]|nr:hypothetical protein AX15_007275 [Amanita polypyramis BW_CC]
MDGQSQTDLSTVGQINDALPSEAVQHIMAPLNDSELDYQRVVAEVVDTSDVKQPFADRVQRFKATIAQHKDFPKDVIQRIFKLYIPSPEAEVASPQVKPWLTLTRVCHLWRQAALNMPELWSDVTLCITEGNNYRRIASASSWLKRGANRLKSLKILTRYDMWDVTDEWYSDVVLKLILPFQFQRLYVGLTCSLNKQISLVPSGVFVSIEDLQFYPEFDIDAEDVNFAWTSMFYPYSRFPKLRTLAIQGKWAVPYLRQMLSSSSLLLNLVLTARIPVSVAHDIIRQAPLLEHCDITVTQDKKLIKKVHGTVILSHLHYLRVKLTDGSIARHFFSRLKLPTLRNLVVSNMKYCTGCDPSVFTELFELSHPRELSELTIKDEGTTYHVGELIQPVPSLQYLSLEVSTMLDETTVERMSNGLIGPNLANIDVDTTNPEHILRVAEARYLHMKVHDQDQKKIAVLKNLEIHCFGGISDESMKWAETLRSYGLHVCLLPQAR